MITLNRIYHDDTFKLLPKIENGSIDLIICDGPYGVTNNNWDKIHNIQEYNLNLIKIFVALANERLNRVALDQTRSLLHYGQ